MVQLEMSALEQKTQALRDRLQSMDDDFRREHDDRRRPGRAKKVSPSLIPLLRGEAVPYRLLSDELDPPYGLEHTTPMFGVAVSLVMVTPLLSILSLVAWAVLR